MKLVAALLGACATLAAATVAHAQTTLTIATVNNGDMIRMEKLSGDFTQKNPGIQLNWVTLEENTLRQKVTTDIATKAGEYDIMTIGTYEVPIWTKQKWLRPLDHLGPNYDVNDLLPPIRQGLSTSGTLYAAPFYGESSFLMYRKDLFEKAGIKMNGRPTWNSIKQAAAKITDKPHELYGICLRGKPGWGENMAFLTTMANSYGGRWFNEKWHPQFNTAAWKDTLAMYLDLMKNYGPPGASSNGFNENLALFQSGKCGMWVDATVAASFVSDPKQSKVANDVAYAQAPCAVTCKDANWLWAWSLAIPASSKKQEAAEKFISWATDKAYAQLVASKDGWANVPPGTRKSLYDNPEYLKAAPFAKPTLAAIDSANPGLDGTLKPKPYIGVQFAAIPEFQGIATAVGQQFAAALTGQMTAAQALANAQRLTEREMRRGGYMQ